MTSQEESELQRITLLQQRAERAERRYDQLRNAESVRMALWLAERLQPAKRFLDRLSQSIDRLSQLFASSPDFLGNDALTTKTDSKEHSQDVLLGSSTRTTLPTYVPAPWDSTGAGLVNAPNVVVVKGMPNNGKTTLSEFLQDDETTLWIKTDALFYPLAERLGIRDVFLRYPGTSDEHFSVARYVDSEVYDESAFVEALQAEIEAALQSNPGFHTLVLDGYVMKNFTTILSAIGVPSERSLILEATRTRHGFFINDLNVTDFNFGSVLSKIQDHFETSCRTVTVARSKYQGYDMLGSSASDSDSLAKFSASDLVDVLGPRSRFVDIGCNAGYFCIKAAERSEEEVVGVDAVRTPLLIASHINNSIFRHSNVRYICADAFDYLANAESGSFDVIHCASTYHYFRERQVEFLRLAHKTLQHDGRLVLEVELAPTETDPNAPSRVEHLSRGVDSEPCDFPDIASFKRQIEGLFLIDRSVESVFQRGSFFDRRYFHLLPM